MAQKKAKVGKMRRKSPPLIESPVGPSKRKPTLQERYPSRAHPDVGIGIGRQLEAIDPLRDFTPKEQEMMNKQLEKFLKERYKKYRRVPKRTSPSGTIATKKGGKVVYKRNGGMSRVGLSPAEEARAGVMSEAARRRPRMPTPRPQPPVRPALRPQPPVRTPQLPVGTPQLPVRPIPRPPVPQMAPPRPMNKGGKVGKKKSKGKRISSKQTNGNDVIAAVYDKKVV